MKRNKLIVALSITLILAAAFTIFGGTGLSGFLAGIVGGLIGMAVGFAANRYL